MSDPTPYIYTSIGQLPTSGDPRVDTNYFLRVIRGCFENGNIGSPVSSIDATRSTTQTISTASETTLTFDTDENLQGANIEHTTAGSFTIMADGVYLIGAQIQASTATIGTIDLYIKVNGGTFVTADSGTLNALRSTYPSCDRTKKLSAGDVVTVTAYQDSGGDIDLTTLYCWITEQR